MSLFLREMAVIQPSQPRLMLLYNTVINVWAKHMQHHVYKHTRAKSTSAPRASVESPPQESTSSALAFPLEVGSMRERAAGPRDTEPGTLSGEREREMTATTRSHSSPQLILCGSVLKICRKTAAKPGRHLFVVKAHR